MRVCLWKQRALWMHAGGWRNWLSVFKYGALFLYPLGYYHCRYAKRKRNFFIIWPVTGLLFEDLHASRLLNNALWYVVLLRLRIYKIIIWGLYVLTRLASANTEVPCHFTVSNDLSLSEVQFFPNSFQHPGAHESRAEAVTLFVTMTSPAPAQIF